MTEAEWLACDDPQALWEFVFDTASDRKWRLLAVALCRCIWPLLLDPRSRAAVEVAERYADGEASEGERADASIAANTDDVIGADGFAAAAALHAVGGPHHVHLAFQMAF